MDFTMRVAVQTGISLGVRERRMGGMEPRNVRFSEEVG